MRRNRDGLTALKFSQVARRVALQALADGGVLGKLVLEP
jgi:hypothetical protein